MQRNKRTIKRIYAVLAAVFAFIALNLCACSNQAPAQNEGFDYVTVTVFDGEHYKVSGDNKKTIARGDDVCYEIAVDKGYELVSSFGKDCVITPFKVNPSFDQTVSFLSVNYDTAVTLFTRELEVTDFSAVSNVTECKVDIVSTAGRPSDGKVYVDDEIKLYAIPTTGYRFYCWSEGGFIADGGKYFSGERILEGCDFNAVKKLYANFKAASDTARTIIYDFGNGVTVEQDCSAIVAHHYRANTLTEPDLESYGINLPKDKMLTGWQTEGGDYVGLGWRTEVSDEKFVTMYPLYKAYTDESSFTVKSGIVTDYTPATANEKELVIPQKVSGQTVTGIAANAFKECKAETVYVPNTVTSIAANAFLNCTELKNFYMSDSVTSISDESFLGCKNFTTLYLNAYLKPRYNDQQNAIKADVIDKLIIDKQKKKCVVLGGSSVMYCYNTKLSERLIGNNFAVYNLGCNLAMCGFAYYDIIDEYLESGDIFLHAPEQSMGSWGGYKTVSKLTGEQSYSITIERLFHITECNWQLLSGLRMNKYANFFNIFSQVNKLRFNMAPKEYYDYPSVISDGEVGGAMITGEVVYGECAVAAKNFGLNGNINLSSSREYATAANSELYAELSSKNVNVCIAFAPTNRHNLLVTYGDEETLCAAAEEYTQGVKDCVSENVHVLLTQYDTIYDGEYFVDTDYHLGRPTRDEHTTKIMTALIEALGFVA